jgi:hypothetical protein
MEKVPPLGCRKIGKFPLFLLSFPTFSYKNHIPVLEKMIKKWEKE